MRNITYSLGPQRPRPLLDLGSRAATYPASCARAAGHPAVKIIFCDEDLVLNLGVV